MTIEQSPEIVPLRGIRRTIARRMTLAWEVPVFHLSATLAMEPAQARRAQLPGASLTDVLLRDCATALAAHPSFNSHFLEEGIATFDQQNIGLAAATERGVVVPVIQDVGGLDDTTLIEERKRMVEIARGGVMKPEHFANGTFTLSNLGMYGVEQFDAILNVPQVAILAVGATRAVNGGSGAATVTLTCDHRAIDGAMGGEFLRTLRDVVER